MRYGIYEFNGEGNPKENGLCLVVDTNNNNNRGIENAVPRIGEQISLFVESEEAYRKYIVKKVDHVMRVRNPSETAAFGIKEPRVFVQRTE